MQLRYSHRSWNDPVIAEVSGNGEVLRQEQSGNLAGRFIFENLVRLWAWCIFTGVYSINAG